MTELSLYPTRAGRSQPALFLAHLFLAGLSEQSGWPEELRDSWEKIWVLQPEKVQVFSIAKVALKGIALRTVNNYAI